MENAIPIEAAVDPDLRLVEAFRREKRGLRRFIRSRVPADIDAEDILQEVFYELVVAYRLMKPVAHAGAWLLQVARNRIADLFRARRPELSADGDSRVLAGLLASPDGGPDAVYMRRVLLDEIEAALDELPASQREVFVAHELEGRSFKDLAAETGTSVATLLSRKHYAVLHLRRRLRAIYEDFRK